MPSSGQPVAGLSAFPRAPSPTTFVSLGLEPSRFRLSSRVMVFRSMTPWDLLPDSPESQRVKEAGYRAPAPDTEPDSVAPALLRVERIRATCAGIDVVYADWRSSDPAAARFRRRRRRLARTAAMASRRARFRARIAARASKRLRLFARTASKTASRARCRLLSAAIANSRARRRARSAAMMVTRARRLARMPAITRNPGAR